MDMIERLAAWYLRRRGVTILPHGWRGLAIGGHGTMAVCEGYDNTKFSAFAVTLAPHSQLVAVNHTLISAPSATIRLAVDMNGATT